jgi:uncharacterized membrane protein
MTYLITYIVTAIVFLGLDALWLGVIAKDYIFSLLSDHIKDQPNFGIAAAFYAVYVVGIIIFAIKPALEVQQLSTAFLYGALFGFFCYATYELTNYSTLKNWPAQMVVMDIAWGTLLTSLAAAAGYYAKFKFG